MSLGLLLQANYSQELNNNHNTEVFLCTETVNLIYGIPKQIDKLTPTPNNEGKFGIIEIRVDLIDSELLDRVDIWVKDEDNDTIYQEVNIVPGGYINEHTGRITDLSKQDYLFWANATLGSGVMRYDFYYTEKPDSSPYPSELLGIILIILAVGGTTVVIIIIVKIKGKK